MEVMSRMIALLAALRFGLSFEERTILETYLCPQLKEGTEQGWEETVDASLTYLLKVSITVINFYFVFVELVFNF